MWMAALTLIFRDRSWPHTSAMGLGSAVTLALTTVTYDVQKGDIYDADIEVNSVLPNAFTTSDAPGSTDIDLLSVLTHEVGHFFGLAHSAEQATMFPDYTKGTTGIRTLKPDDMAAICAAYPPGRHPVGECSGLPRHGFAPECVDQQTYVKCGVAPGATGVGSAAALALIAGLTLRRRATRPRGPHAARAKCGQALSTSGACAPPSASRTGMPEAVMPEGVEQPTRHAAAPATPVGHAGGRDAVRR